MSGLICCDPTGKIANCFHSIVVFFPSSSLWKVSYHMTLVFPSSPMSKDRYDVFVYLSIHQRPIVCLICA